MKIVKFKDGRFALRKWMGIFLYADKDSFSRWGWWPKQYEHNYKVKTFEDAESLLSIVRAANDSGKAIPWCKREYGERSERNAI